MATKAQTLTDKVAEIITTALQPVDGITVLRNQPLQFTTQEAGYVNIVDPATLERGQVTLGILQYEYTMRVSAVIITTGSAAAAKKENIINLIATAVTTNDEIKTMVDRIEVESPETVTEHIADASKVRVTVLPILVNYRTPNSMG